ncbi:hypothetical protein GW17_00007428 [Ensete ventricosum]|nr:hypothetical protein GW17_00007428 [Ensete ventricosum]
MCSLVFTDWEASGQILSIGVISPYSYQVNAIMERLGNKYEAYDGFRIRVKSIDGFQGEEDDVIILSTVRSSDKANIGFLQDHQRTNVALTRARYSSHLSFLFNIQVLFSDDFKKSFSRLRHFRAKKEVIHLLLSLSNGLRSKSQIRGISDSFDLVRIYKVMDLYLIWTVDIIKDERYVQVIKVWDLLPLEQIARLVSRLDYIFSTYTEVYLKHCKAAFVEGYIPSS